ncbi:malonyl CoA-ACP transacylase [Acetobacter estunensis NRIC 0472]|uniref:Malonyl CoA-acyl carrier protein transacylase n=1 Tax=Acetobacter estunensis TaxID=104097 RepID=A0A967BCL9_9PROT|nr:ACP S-malonyltransferase [Acetobacter estunensis]NHO54573.1 ACP S-malonyltransferase [Acetobacter estunensis]GBQ26734.1 malonyl CoA-ACP transacylase [Acetobacter estunensis NRIC 0472]
MPVYAFVFPGQGSQSPGMGQDLADAFSSAREVFQEVDDALGEHLSKTIFEGPAESLTSTENAQPALMAVSMAVVRVLEREGGIDFSQRATLMAGHSLGEYSALAAARSFGIAQTARLLRLRGQAMQRAVPAGEGGMAALIGVTPEQAREVCAEAAIVKVEGEPERREIIEIANDNGGDQIVVSGQIGAIDRAIAIAKEKGIKRAVKLPVSAPFHSSLMRPAAEEMAEALAQADIRAPIVPIVANVTAEKVTSPDTIRDLLVKQVTGTVRWRESVDAMVGMGIDHFVELGAGKVLSGLIRRIAPEAKTQSVGSVTDIDSFLQSF